MSVLFATHPRFADHDSGPHHPERPARLGAVEAGIEAAGLGEAIVRVSAPPAPDEALERVHPAAYRRSLQSFCETGGGYLDGDTHVVPASWEAARLAAGAGIDLAARLTAGEGEVGFCAVRPPGHHARPSRAMGFCLLNNVAITAADLAARGERVLVVDYDAHHGNGTQEAFWTSGDVFYISMHEWPLYPGTGRLEELGEGAGRGLTRNLPFPAGTTGDVYRRAVAEVVAPAVEAFGPTWLLISAGFDGHRRDPLTDLGLTAADLADVTSDLAAFAPVGRRLLFLEGGYDLEALAACTGAVLSALVDGGAYRPETPTSGGPGAEVCAAALNIGAATADE